MWMLRTDSQPRPYEVSETTDTDSAAREALLSDCHGRAGVPLTIEIGGSPRRYTLTLNQPIAVIGSDPDCDVCLDHPDLLPRHACLHWVDGGIYCQGLDARSAAISGWIHAEPLSIGPCRISIAGFPAPEERNPLARNTELAEFPAIQLRFAGVEQNDNLWPVDRALTFIGRGPQCRLRLAHPDIPDVLASLVRTPTSCWIINWSDSAAVEVNDQPVTLHSLDPGDMLQLGLFRAEICSSAPAAAEATVDDLPATAAVRELASEHRQRLGELNDSLAEIQVYLDSPHLDTVPEFKSALRHYVQQVQRHHRELQDALDRLAAH